MDKKEFVWLAQGGEGYGVLNAIFTLADQCRKHGHRVRVLVLREGLISEHADKHGYEVINLGVDATMSVTNENKLQSVFRSVSKMMGCVRAIRDWLKREKVDYLYIVPNIMAVPGSIAAKLAGVQAVWEMSNAVGDDYPFSLNKRFYQLALRFSNTIVLANSAYSGTTVAGWGVKPITFHLGVDEEKFQPGKSGVVTRQELGLSDEDVVFALYARMTESKGQARLIEAIGQLKNEFSTLKVCLAGGPMDSQYVLQLQDRVKELELEDRVIFLGQLSDVERFYDFVDVALNLRVDPEPFGLSVVEAMLMGKPVLVHALGGPAETVIDGETGWHVRDPEITSIVVKLREILKLDRGGGSLMGEKARAGSLRDYTSTAQYWRMMKIIS